MTDHPKDMSRFLENIVNTMNDGLFLVNPDGTIRMVNDALTRMLGYSREELVGRPCTVLDCDVCGQARARGRTHWCRIFEIESQSRKPCFIRRKDGSMLRVLKNASPLREGGEVVGVVETLTDITEIGQKEEQIQELRRLLETGESFHGLVGKSPVMRRTCELLEKAALSDAPVIIYGESGTGKELAAHAIHELGRRSDGPYIQCNCAALNESLLESELFGHAKGAFTGAYRHRAGRFEAAHGGDLFLDEIGDAPLEIQVKLLRVLETKRFERVGDNRPVEVDVRFISATNRNLTELVAQGRFREDLYFRINVIPIHMPSLRERREDIPLLAEHFAERLRRTSGKDIRGLSPKAMQLLMGYEWPGNVRELKSAFEYAFVIAGSGLIEPEHLPPQLQSGSAGIVVPPPGAAAAEESGPPEKVELVRALKQSGGNKSETARILGVTRVTVLNRMRKYGIDTRTVITS